MWSGHAASWSISSGGRVQSGQASFNYHRPGDLSFGQHPTTHHAVAYPGAPAMLEGPRAQAPMLAPPLQGPAGLGCGAAITAVVSLGLPALLEIFAGWARRGEACDQPLAAWLLADGAAGLTATILISACLCTVCAASQREGATQVHRQEEHALASGTANVAYQAQSKQLNGCESCVLQSQCCALLLPALLWLLGCLLHGLAGRCSGGLRGWTLAALVYKPFSSAATACCILPRLFLA